MAHGERCFVTALIQSKVDKMRQENLKNTTRLIEEAVMKHKAQLVCLPECFNSPYGTSSFKEYAEVIPTGPSSKTLQAISRKFGIFLVGGTIPELDEHGQLYNTCTVWNPYGDLILKYRKMHLFDIDIPGQVAFKESDVIKSGSTLGIATLEELHNIKIGVGICYDIRFEELAKLYRLSGCDVLIYPGAFTMTTGPLHWELLQRARATDNQAYVFGISPATGTKGYIAWGHSQITDPWGKVIQQAGHDEEIITANIDLNVCEQVREQIPIFYQRRSDIYNTVY